MEEKGIGNIVYIIISVVFVLVSFVLKKKKRPEPQQSIPFPDINTIPDVDVRERMEQSMSDSSQMQPNTQQRMKSIFDILGVTPEETQKTPEKLTEKPYLQREKKEVVKGKTEEIHHVLETFDPVKAIIYSEIMARKF